MRLVYLDEAGVSNPTQEPVLVVAGVIVNPDSAWKRIETYFSDLARDLFPDEDPHRFVFHAMDIWHGSGAFKRSRWTRPKRLQVLAQLAQVPRLFRLPIVIGAMDRETVRMSLAKNNPRIGVRNATMVAHMTAFGHAMQSVEHWMRKFAPNEVTILIAEDAGDVRAVIDRLHEGYSNRTDGIDGEGFRSAHIVEGVQFSRKAASPVLQIADHCAFIIKRQMSGKDDVRALYEAIRPQIYSEQTPARGFYMRFHLSEIEVIDDSA